jgi:hypothetical protein
MATVTKSQKLNVPPINSWTLNKIENQQTTLSSLVTDFPHLDYPKINPNNSSRIIETEAMLRCVNPALDDSKLVQPCLR